MSVECAPIHCSSIISVHGGIYYYYACGRNHPDKMENLTADKNNIAACGLYCGACRKFLSGKCPGCEKNEKASWCKIRQCCISKGYHTCAECKRDVRECKTYSNFLSKVFAFIFNSDRPACISYIREEMSRKGCQTIKRK